MLCSARELGLGEEHEGIMELARTLALNLDLRKALDLDDTVLEVNATPNRGDCMSVFGIARDYAAAQERRYLKLERRPGAAPFTRAVFPVRIDAAEGCPVFSSRVIRGVDPKARDARMDARAAAPGRPQQHFSDRRCHQLRDDRTRAAACTPTIFVPLAGAITRPLGEGRRAADAAGRQGVRARVPSSW